MRYNSLSTDGRQRDVFPLPTVQTSGKVERDVSRSVARRIQLRDHLWKRVNRAILSLNSLYFGHAGRYGRVAVEDLSQLPLVQKEIILRIRQQLKCLGPPPDHASYQGALSALRVSSSAYVEADAGVGEVVSMNLAALSLPSGSVAGVDLACSLSGSIREVVLNYEEHMLQDAGTWMDLEEIAGKMKTYNDPLLHDRQSYIDFLCHLHERGILGFTSTCRGRVGAFAVSKKPKFVDGKRVDRQRLVLDCRSTNLQFKAPPITRLGSLSALGELEVPSDHTMYMAGADIRDCFYGCRCPPGLEDFFCLKDDLTLAEWELVTGGNCDASTLGHRICPCITVLPMGFTWSFYIIQALHEQISLRSLNMSEDHLIRDAHPPPSLSGKDVAAMPYCDNVHSISLDAAACQDGADNMCAGLRGAGFELHEEVGASTLFPTLGGMVDGVEGTVKPSSSRLWNLIFAFEYASEAVVSTDLVRRLLGHAMVVCVLHRGGMSIFRYLYDFVQRGGPPRKLNYSESSECKTFAGILPLLYADLKKKWSSTITCSDASPEGFGICEMESDVATARALGKWQERWRFRRLAPEEWKPRQRGSGRDPFGDVRTARGNLADIDDLDSYIENEAFPEVPGELLNPERWKTVSMGKWKHSQEHITLKEGRALVLAVRRMTRASQQRGLKHVVLLDNLSLCFAVGKGRCHNFQLLRIVQQLSALCLSSGILLRPRWVRSEINVADGPSRGQLSPGPYQKDWGLGTGHDKDIKSSQGKSSCQIGDGRGEISDIKVFASPVSKEEEEGPKENFECWLLPSQASESQEGRQSYPQGAGGGCGNQGQAESLDRPGDPKRERRDPAPVPGLLQQVRGLLQGERRWVATQSNGCRPALSRFSRPAVPRWQVCKRRREDSGGFGVSSDRLERASPSFQEGAPRLAKSRAALQPTAAAQAHYVRSSHELDRREQKGYGSTGDGGLSPLLAPRRRTGPEKKECSSSRPPCRQTVPAHHGDHSRSRGWPPRQNWCVRQQPAAGRQAGGLHGISVASQSQDNSTSHRSDFQFLHGRLPEGLYESRGGLRNSLPSSIPTPAWRCHRGPRLQAPGLSKCEGKRKVENRSECEKICEGRSHPAVAGSDECQQQKLLQMERNEHEKGSVWPAGPQEVQVSHAERDLFDKTVPRPRRFALEVFAGSARVSQALCDVGIPTYPIDICLFPSHNVLDPLVHQYIRNLMFSGRILLLWLGMPCTTFSRARRNDGRGPGPLRDLEHLWGLPGLSYKDRLKLREGSKLFSFSMDLLKWAAQLNIPVIIENPLTSLAWCMSPMKKFLASPDVHLCDLDFCQFGERWQKPTDWCIVGWIFLHWLFNVKAPTCIVPIPNGLTFPW